MQYSATIIQFFRKSLLTWGEKNTRKFPWRNQKDPYRVLVSEFMLHRTQTRQVLPVYTSFIKSYPKLKDVRNESDFNLHLLLTPLGLEWRISGMISALKAIWEKYQQVPTEYEELVSIRGIGPYIAGATVCFTQNKPIALVDTNIVRVTGRVFGLSLIGEARRRKELIDTIATVCDIKEPRKFYYAMIDLAHLVCLSRVPDCSRCPLASLPCIFFKQSSSIKK
jgi:A/G-specific adenine glycosylase